MSRIEELIKELAPAGVRQMALGDIAQIASARIDSSRLDASNYVGVENLLPNFGGRKDSEYGANSGGAIRFQPGDLLIGNIRPYLKKVWLADRDGGASPDVMTLALKPQWREEIIPRFLFFLVASESFIAYAMRHARGAKMPRGDKAANMQYPIAVPPRAVQAEIVRILDHFTTLETELLAELAVRKEQRSALTRTLLGALYGRLPNGATNEVIQLGELASQYVEPVRVLADDTYTNLGVKWYGEGAFARESKLGSAIKGTTLYRVKPRQLVYNRMFVTEGSFAVIPPELAEGVVSNEFPVFDLDSSRVEPEWLLAYFQDEFTLKRIAGEVTGTERGSTKSRRRWKENQFEAFQIELPPLPAQQEFLRVIGTVANLESALREEIVARRHQYEYYSVKLLTFQQEAA